MQRVVFYWAPALMFACFAYPARASEDTPHFGLAWVRDAGADACLDQQSLRRAVQKRLGREPFSDEAERTIEGSVMRSGRLFTVTLRVRDAAGLARGERHLERETDDCAELSEAVVLAVALTIDPNAPATADPSLVVTDEVMSTASREPSKISAPPPVEPVHSLAVPAPPCPACGANDSEILVSFSLRGATAFGVLPGLAPGATLTGGVDHPRVRGTLSASWFPEQSSDDGRFSFGLSTLNAGACGGLASRGPLSVALCAELQVGAMHAVVHELAPLDPGDHLFMALASGPVFGLITHSGMQIELGAQALVPLVRPEFLVRGENGTAFQSRPVAAVGFVGVGIGAARRP